MFGFNMPSRYTGNQVSRSDKCEKSEREGTGTARKFSKKTI